MAARMEAWCKDELWFVRPRYGLNCEMVEDEKSEKSQNDEQNEESKNNEQSETIVSTSCQCSAEYNLMRECAAKSSEVSGQDN